MIKVTKIDAREDLQLSGRTITLVTRTWSFTFHTPWFGVGARYQHPRSIEDRTTRKIHDYVMLARAAALAVVVLAILLGKEDK